MQDDANGGGGQNTYILLQHELGVLIFPPTAVIDALLEFLDLSFLAKQLFVIGGFLFEKTAHSAGCDGELRRGRHDGRVGLAGDVEVW